MNLAKHTYLYLQIRYIIEKLLICLISPLILFLFLSFYLYLKIILKNRVIFVQRRLGINNSEFNMYKFRTMNFNGEVVPQCRILRKLRLDELPQFWNVLKGQMSLIGPRPVPVEQFSELSEIIPCYEVRHIIKPGITGLAQVKYGHTLTVKGAKCKFKWDMLYIKKICLKLDIYVLLKTIPFLFSRKME